MSVYGADGGAIRVGVDESIRLDVSATTGPGVTLGVSGVDGSRLAVEATGTGGAPLYVTGPAGGPVISELGQQTANLITNPTCTFGVPQIVTINTTPVQLPSTAESHADPTTKWALLNLSNSQRVCCMGLQSDGGVPDCTTKGYIAMPSGGTISIDGEQSLNVYCRSAAQTALVNVWEASCVQ